MDAKALFFAILKKLQSGFVRFAPFNILALLWALCLMRNNHVAWDDVEAHRMPLALASGACWGMLSSLAARLVLERRKCHAWRSSSLPALCGIAMTVLGALFWYNVRETDMRYTFWEMLYFGSLVSIGAFSIAQLFGKRNAWTIFGRLFLSAVFVCLISFAVWLGSMLCMAAYDELIAKTGCRLFEDISALIWCAMAPMFMAAMLPTDNEPSERPKAFNVLFWFLVPIGMVLMAILYAYIAKIASPGQCHPAR